MKYTITFKTSARKELYALSPPMMKRISSAIDKLEDNPRPAGVKKLKGKDEHLWRSKDW